MTRKADPNLTRTQIRVVQGVASGLTAKEMSRQLGFSVASIECHVCTAMRKLGAMNRTHVAVLALKKGLIEFP